MGGPDEMGLLAVSVEVPDGKVNLVIGMKQLSRRVQTTGEGPMFSSGSDVQFRW